MDGSEPGEVFSFASRKARLYAAFRPLIIGGTFIAVLAIGVPGLWKLLVLPGTIALSLVVWRAAQVALELRYEGPVLRNTFRTYRPRWEDVRGVYLGGGVGWGHCVAFALKDARLGIEADATSDAWRDEQLRQQLRRFAEPHGVELHPELFER